MTLGLSVHGAKFPIDLAPEPLPPLLSKFEVVSKFADLDIFANGRKATSHTFSSLK